MTRCTPVLWAALAGLLLAARVDASPTERRGAAAENGVPVHRGLASALIARDQSALGSGGKAARGRGTGGEVTIEWLYQPFNLPTGHSAVRVGKTVVSFSPDGWEIWSRKGHDALNYLFDNPVAKQQVEAFEKLGATAPAVTIGVPLRVPRQVASQLLRGARRAARGADGGLPFSLLLNNCNTTMLQYLPATYRPSGLSRLMPALTLRSLMSLPERAGPPRLYPLASSGAGSRPTTMPGYLAGRHSPTRELGRIVKNSAASLRTPWIRRYLRQELKHVVTYPLQRVRQRLRRSSGPR